MSNKKATKRALLTSITALAMCVVMLVGTTFAWFTDTASTNVNRIEAGKLDVALEMKNPNYIVGGTEEEWISAEGKMLYFRDKNNKTDILWEPGATFNLDTFKIVNKGNLAIKYEVKVTGIKGSAKLLEVIDFSVVGGTLNGDSVAIGTLMPKGQANDTSDPITIQGKMEESANNDYQGLTLDGIAITVYATQNTYEYDSNDNTYDSGAFDALKDLYPVSNSVAKPATGAAVINDADASGNKQTYQVTVPQEAMDTQASNISVTIAKSASADAKFAVAAGNELKQFDVNVTGIKSDNTTAITVELFIGKGYRLTNPADVQHLKSDGRVESLMGSYDNATGFVTFDTTSFSPFAVAVPEMTAVVGEGLSTCYYDTLADAVAAAKDGGTITFVKSTTEPMKLTLTEPMTLKGITFRAAPGVEIKGLQLISAKSATRLELEDITFKDITFTDAVKLGQDTAAYGPSKCTNITFENCKFDLTDSKDAATSRFAIKRSSAQGTGTDESIYYTNGLTVKNCEFNNVASGIFVSMMRDVTVENCTFTNCKSAAIRFGDVAGNVNIIGNTISNAKGVLSIAYVANNSTTTDTRTNTVIKDNTATSMTCNNGEVFMAAYDNGKTSGKSTYTITGNSCTYTADYSDPLNGFKIAKFYGPSTAEFIKNTND